MLLLHYSPTPPLRGRLGGGSFFIALLYCLIAALPCGAQKREKYEFVKNMPGYYEQLIADLKYPLAWENSTDISFDEWKRVARKKVFDCMLTPPPAATSWDMKVIAEEQRDGYKAMKVEFQGSKYYRIPALILVPDGKGPFPAINALHDHGAHLYIGKEKMIRPIVGQDNNAEDTAVLKDADEWLQLYEGQYVGDYLAKHGYVVFSADAPLWGERGRKEGVDRSKYDIIAGNMMMYGIDLCAYMHYDDITGTEFLASLPYVDAEKIGCIGCSMGAYRAWMLSALSDRVKCGASICWMVSSDVQLSLNYGRSENGGFANCLPGLRRYLDYPHIASLACPKPMLFINGTKDKLFPVPGAEKAFATMKSVWQSQGADKNLKTELWDIPHSCPVKAQEAALEMFDKCLK